MKRIALVALVVTVLSCEADDGNRAPWFSAKPYGETPKASRVDEQKGDELEEAIEPVNFKELTISQGSGLDGFDAIRLFGDGSGYLVFSKTRDRNRKVKIELSEDELNGLIAALNADKITKIKGLYSAGWADGTQGFVEIRTREGRRYCWLDNHFDPVVNLFEYCNRVIWPRLHGAKIDEKGIDRQLEYRRVFQPENQSQAE